MSVPKQLRSFSRQKPFMSKKLPVPDKDVRMALTSNLYCFGSSEMFILFHWNQQM
jgi:hypothetical protein